MTDVRPVQRVLRAFLVLRASLVLRAFSVPGVQRIACVVALASLTLLVACGGGISPLAPSTVPTPEARRSSPTAPAPSGRPPVSGELSPGVTENHLDALWARQLMVPVEGAEPSQLRNDYDARRSGGRTHRAIDVMSPKGTPVLAADDGRIGRIGTTPIGGNIIYATDPDERFVYYYAHLDRHARGLQTGQRVQKGDVIGYVGTTGNAPANVPHLHFQVMLRGAGRAWWDGPTINPWLFFVYSGSSNQ